MKVGSQAFQEKPEKIQLSSYINQDSLPLQAALFVPVTSNCFSSNKELELSAAIFYSWKSHRVTDSLRPLFSNRMAKCQKFHWPTSSPLANLYIAMQNN